MRSKLKNKQIITFFCVHTEAEYNRANHSLISLHNIHTQTKRNENKTIPFILIQTLSIRFEGNETINEPQHKKKKRKNDIIETKETQKKSKNEKE